MIIKSPGTFILQIACVSLDYEVFPLCDNINVSHVALEDIKNPLTNHCASKLLQVSSRGIHLVIRNSAFF